MARHHWGVLAIWATLTAASCAGRPLPDGSAVTASVTPSSGGAITLSNAGVRLDVPAGAVATTTSITLRMTADAAPAGVRADGPIVRFEPSGLVFAKPATVTFTFEHAVHPTIYWTNARGNFEDLGGRVSGSTIATEVTHFSFGFVGERKPPLPDAGLTEDVAPTPAVDASVDTPAAEDSHGEVPDAATDAPRDAPVPQDAPPDTVAETICRPRVPAQGAWVNRTPAVFPASWPIARNSPAVAYDPATRKTVMFGGYGGPAASYLMDTWEWDGPAGVWRQILVAGPPFDGGTSFAYDSARQRMVLFAGFSRQVWEWNGVASTWSNRTPAILPAGWAPMIMGTMGAYDPDRRRVVIFDISYGVNGAKSFEWDPATEGWTARTPSNGPTTYFGPFTWDPVRKRGVLLGGANLTDVWEWDAVAGSWTLRPHPAGAAWPSQRSGAAMAFDAGRGRPVLWGGQPPGGPFDPAMGPPPPVQLNDLWEWDGDRGQWTEIDDGTSSPSPPGFASKVMVYDADRSCLVMIGGNFLNDSANVWEWRRVAAVDGGLPSPGGCADGGAP